METRSYNLVEDYVLTQDQFFSKHIDECICLGICTITNKGTLSIYRLTFDSHVCSSFSAYVGILKSLKSFTIGFLPLHSSFRVAFGMAL